MTTPSDVQELISRLTSAHGRLVAYTSAPDMIYTVPGAVDRLAVKRDDVLMAQYRIAEAATTLAAQAARIEELEKALRTTADIFEDMYRYGVVYTPSPDDKGEFTSAYYLGEGIMPMIRAVLQPPMPVEPR